MAKDTIKLGIGFATGRKNFRKVLTSYIYSWKESGFAESLGGNVSLSLFVAYDLNYSNTQSTDYTNLPQDAVDAFDHIVFLGEKSMQSRSAQFVDDGILSANDTKDLFSSGYAGKRNAILYSAMEKQMDYLLYLDDDEYPVAVTNNHGNCLWSGQYVLSTHLSQIENADITNGHHCGYISPIPHIDFGDELSENDFSKFIGALSNDILNWDSIRKIMDNGGVTYADSAVLISNEAQEVGEVNRCKFISGSNLCINLKSPQRVFPFYNPPGARGEDTFLSSLLSDRKVMRVPCYTFHDGFSAYKHLLDGVLPIKLATITAHSNEIVTRFYNACIGWIRYKPLLLYITAPEKYEESIKQIRATLVETAPKLCKYFDNENFMNIVPELDKYSKNVQKHHKHFLNTQNAWSKLIEQLPQT